MSKAKKYLHSQTSDYLINHPRINSSHAIIKLINGYFWRSISGPFLAFAFPLLLVCILGFTVGYMNAFPGSFLLGIIVTGLNVMPSTISDFRKSSLLKRISVTPVSSKRVLLSICGFYLIIMVISVIFVVACTVLIFAKNWTSGDVMDFTGLGSLVLPSLSTIFAHVDWVAFTYTIILTIIISLALGLAFASLFKSQITIQSISIMLMIVVILTSGLSVPNQITKANDALWFGGYITPFKPIINTSCEAWNGDYSFIPKDINGDDISGLLPGYTENPRWLNHNLTNLNGSSVFNLTKPYEIYSTVILPGGSKFGAITILSVPEKYVNLIVPYAWLILLVSIIGTKFKWTNR